MLVLCPECQMRISSLSEVCIHCGYPCGAMRRLGRYGDDITPEELDSLLGKSGQKDGEQVQSAPETYDKDYEAYIMDYGYGDPYTQPYQWDDGPYSNDEYIDWETYHAD